MRFDSEDSFLRRKRGTSAFMRIHARVTVFEKVVVRIGRGPRHEGRSFRTQILLPLRLVLAASHAIHRLISGIIVLLRERTRLGRIRISLLPPCRKSRSLTPQFISPRLRVHHLFLSLVFHSSAAFCSSRISFLRSLLYLCIYSLSIVTHIVIENRSVEKNLLLHDQNPAREREMTYSKSGKRKRDDLFKIRQERER